MQRQLVHVQAWQRIEQTRGDFLDPVPSGDRGDSQRELRAERSKLRAKDARIAHHARQQYQRFFHLPAFYLLFKAFRVKPEVRP